MDKSTEMDMKQMGPFAQVLFSSVIINTPMGRNVIAK